MPVGTSGGGAGDGQQASVPEGDRSPGVGGWPPMLLPGPRQRARMQSRRRSVTQAARRRRSRCGQGSRYGLTSTCSAAPPEADPRMVVMRLERLARPIRIVAYGANVNFVAVGPRTLPALSVARTRMVYVVLAPPPKLAAG